MAEEPEIDAHAMEISSASDEIIAQIGPLLHGKGPELQGAVLAELVAMWLGGHPPSTRCYLLKIHNDLVKNFVELHDPWADGSEV